MFSIGLGQDLHIRQEVLTPRSDPCHLLYISDIHLRKNRSDHLCRQVTQAARSQKVDALLLGGDLVDAATELGKLSELVATLRGIAPVFAVGGNHDWHVGMDRVSDAVVAGGGDWIHAKTVLFPHGNRVLAISGPEANSLPTLSGTDYRILCAHNPRILKRERNRGFDLILAGHLHGCQVVAFEFRDRLFPGALFYPYCYLNHKSGSTRLVVSRGVSDLIPIRWRCPREVVSCLV